MIPKVLSALSRRLDRYFWQEADGGQEVLLDRTSIPFEALATYRGDDRFATSMIRWEGSEQEEYIDRIRGDIRVEPARGWLILPGRRLHMRALPYAYNAARPSAIDSVLHNAWPRKVLELDRCISLRDVYEHNYYHFFNDVLPKLALLEEAALLDAPVLVGHQLYTKPFFQAVLPALNAAGITIVDQADRFVHSKEVIYCKPMPFSRGLYERVLDLIQAPAADADADAMDRVFLIRKPSGAKERIPLQMDRLIELVESHGFTAVDPGELTLHEQMQLMKGTRWLIGIHGAGLTNMIFRRGAPLDVLEIFAADLVAPHYHWLARTFGYGYSGIVGGERRADGRFEVPLSELDQYLKTWLKP